MKKSVVLPILLLAAFVAVLWFAGRPAYHRSSENRNLRQAEHFLAKGDYRNASRSARQALAANPRSLRACAVMAQLCELARAPRVLDWRRRLTELSPTPQNKLLLASAALRVEGPPYELAAQTLEELAPSATNLAGFHVVSAELALKLNQPFRAEGHLEAASRIEPTNQMHRLNLAVLRLRSTNSFPAAQARATLESLSANTSFSAVALRWLVIDHLRRKDFKGAEQCSTRLLATSQSVFEDRLQHLGILDEAKDPEFDTFLTATRRSAVTNAVEVYALGAWLVGHERAAEAKGWLDSLPFQIRSGQPVPLAFVYCYTAAKDWRGLDEFLQEAKWGELEFMRQAFLSRCAAEQKDELSADAHWRLALKEAGDRLGTLTAMLATASSWGHEKAEEDLLWRIIHRNPRERWAFWKLECLYAAQGNTRGLNRLYALLMNYDCRNVVAKNNFAATSLLLNVSVSRAHDIARELALAHPDDPVVASTYAYSLHSQGRTADGLAILGRLKPDFFKQPALALYYGVLLQADRQTNKAAHYLALAQKGPLLPEEKALATQALQTGP